LSLNTVSPGLIVFKELCQFLHVGKLAATNGAGRAL
jgi:hypothetical protein